MKDKTAVNITLRRAGKGDWGWMLQKHGTAFDPEIGWDTDKVEAFVASALGEFIPKHKLPGHGAWIAEADGVPVGSVMVERKDEVTSRLRLLQVIPEGRGMGVGFRLVNEVVEFSKNAGYSKVILFTTSLQADVVRLYQKCGFKYTHSNKFDGFGPELEGVFYELVFN